MRHLVIAAHPDDEVLGAGGLMARQAAAGDKVVTAILGEGLTSRRGSRETIRAEDLEALHENARRANALLGVGDVRFFGLPDNRFDTVPLLDVVKHIEGLIDEIRPDAIYTQHGGDLNVDHEITFRATLTATRPMQGHSLHAVYAYEVASSTEWAFGQFAPRFSPQMFFDIEASLEKKIKAMAQYTSESRPFPHPRSAEALRAAAARWGSCVGLRAAEPFSVIWQTR